MTDKIYNHTEMTDITQYNVEEASTFMGGKKYVPVFHGLQPKPGGVTELHEGYVEIGGPADTPWDTEDYDDLILAQSGKERPIHPDSIAVSPTTGTVKLANPLVTLQLSAVVTPTSSEFPVTWSTSSNKVTVSNTGLVTPVAEGEDIAVTATSGAVSASAVIKVEKVGVTSVAITEESLSLAPEATEQLHVTVSPSTAYVSTVNRSSSDEAVATVSDAGLVTAVADGTATITATSTDDTSKTDTCTVTVTTPEPETPTETETETETPTETPTEPGE